MMAELVPAAPDSPPPQRSDDVWPGDSDLDSDPSDAGLCSRPGRAGEGDSILAPIAWVLQIGGERIVAVTFDSEWGDLFSEAVSTAQSFCGGSVKFATWSPWDGERAICLDRALAAYQATEEL
jgi:hypothetical protein